MAYTDFYVQSAGNNANSGSSPTNTIAWQNASVAWTGGSGGGGNNTFVVTDATASAISVGDYINIGGGWVSQVTGVSNVGSVYTVVMSTTVAWGTEPATNASIGAVDGGSFANITGTIFTGSTTVPSSTRINIQAATYTTGANLNIQLKGTTTAPVWFRGYNTTPGDLDNGSTSLAYPLLSLGATFIFNMLGGYVLWSGLSFSGNRSGAAVGSSTASPIRIRHCQFANTSSNSAATAFSAGVAVTTLVNCSFTTPSTANAIVSVSAGTEFINCYFTGASSGSTQVGIASGTTAAGLIMAGCTVTGTGSYGVNCTSTTGPVQIINCTFNACGGDSIRFTTAMPGTGVLTMIAGCAFFKSGGYDINNSTGTNTANVELAGNLSYSPTSGHLNGFGDWAELNALVDSSDPRKSATDLHLIPTSNGAGAGLPQQWEGQTAGLASTPDVGAWQRLAGGSSGPIAQITGTRANVVF
jgi:hypothetical protein